MSGSPDVKSHIRVRYVSAGLNNLKSDLDMSVNYLSVTTRACH
nr:MAG TPA: hypothetical protein [Caudoviricetes sp.]DAH37516.1 MAG TPA: hypothetical protein [Caudoviricetes sp.]